MIKFEIALHLDFDNQSTEWESHLSSHYLCIIFLHPEKNPHVDVGNFFFADLALKSCFIGSVMHILFL